MNQNYGKPTDDEVKAYESLLKKHDPNDESHKGKIGACIYCMSIEIFQYKYPLEARAVFLKSINRIIES